jgi:hypothetical protein
MTPNYRRATTAALVLATIAATACGGSDDDQTVAATAAPSAPVTTEAVFTTAAATTAAPETTAPATTTSSSPDTVATTVEPTSPPTTAPDDTWRPLAAASCAAWVPLVTTPAPTTGDPAGLVAYVQTMRDAYDAAPGVETIHLPEGPGRTSADLAAVDAAARAALDRAAVAAAGGDLGVTQDEVDRFRRNVASRASGFVAAGQSCGPGDAAVAAQAALNVSIVGPWQLEIGYGSVWVSQTDGRDPQVVRIDPDDGTLLATIPMPSRPFKIQAADGRMIVRTLASYVALDPTTNAVVGTLAMNDVGPNAGRNWAVDGALWICDGQRLHRYDPATLQPVATVELGIDCGQVHATDDLVTAWTYNEDIADSGSSRAAFVDPATNSVQAAVDLAGDSTVPVVLDDAVFFPPNYSQWATVVDRATWSVSATPDFGQPIEGRSQAAFDGTSIYIIAEQATGTIVSVDPVTFAVTGELKTIATVPSLNSVAATPGVVWAVSNGAGILQRFDTD